MTDSMEETLPADEASASGSSYRYRAFISYPREALEAKHALWLQGQIEQYDPPVSIREQGFDKSLDRVFVDDTELSGASSLTETIRDSLKASEWLIVICSPVAAKRPWVNEEVRYFSEDLGRADLIIPVLVAGTPETALPQMLAARDMLAVDLRDTRRRARRRAAIRVVAILLGCEFDQLWRRNEERRARRLTQWGLVASLVVSLLAASGLYALLQRQEREASDARAQLVESEKRLAEKAREVAVGQQALAEAAERQSRAIAHYSAGAQAEQAQELDLARLQYATALSVLDRPEFRRKVSDLWDAPALLWQAAVQVVPPRDDSPIVRPALLLPRNTQEVWIATGLDRVDVLDRQTGKQLRTVQFDRPVTAMAEHPKGDWVAVALNDGAILIVDPKRRVTTRRFDASTAVASMAVDSDGRFLAVGLLGEGLLAIDATSGVRRWKSPPGQHESTVGAVAFAPLGPRALWAMGRHLYWVDLDRDDFGMVASLDGEVATIAWSTQEELAAAGGLDGPIFVNGSLIKKGAGVAVELISARKRKTPEFWDIAGHAGGTFSVQFFDRSSRMASGGFDNTVRVWGTRSAQLIFALRGHATSVMAVSVPPEGDQIVSIGADGRVIAWTLGKGGRAIWSNESLADGSGFAGAVGSFAPAGVLARPNGDKLVALRNQSVWKLRGSGLGAQSIASARGSVYLRRPLFQSADHSVYARVTPSAGRIDNLPGMAEIERLGVPGRKLWHVGGLAAAAPTGPRRWVIGLRKGNVEMRDWGAATGVVLARRGSSVVDVDASQSALVALWRDRQLQIFSADGMPRRSVETQEDAHAVRLSPDGRLVAIASAGASAAVRVIDAESGKELVQRPLWASAMAFSPDGRLLALGSEATESVVLIQTKDWSTLATWRREGHRIADLAFTIDGKWLLTGGGEGTVRQWDVAAALEALDVTPGSLLETATARSGLALSGLEPRPRPIARPAAGQVVRLPTPSRDSASTLAALIGEAKDGASDAKTGLRENLRRGLASCSGGLSSSAELDTLCTLGEVELARMDPDMAEGLLTRAAERTRTASMSKEPRRAAGSVAAYAGLARAYEGTDTARALTLLLAGIDVHQRLLIANPTLVPPFQQLSQSYAWAEQMIRATDEPEELSAFLRRTGDFLDAARQIPRFSDFASQGYALYRFRLGQVLASRRDFKGAESAFAAADDSYGELVGRLVQAGDPNSDRARLRWAEVVTLRALSMFAAIPRGDDRARDASSREQVRIALQQVDRAIGQIEALGAQAKATDSARQLRSRLGTLKQRLEED